MGDVVDLNVVTTLDLDPARVLEKVSREKFKRVIVIGLTEDDEEFFSSSVADGGTIVWDMERVKHKLMRLADD